MNQKVKCTIQMCGCTSSQIASHGFDPATGTLALQFKRAGPNKGERVPGTIYRYSNVTPAQYSAFLAAESKGTAFGAMFKDVEKFPFEKQTPDDAVFHPMLPAETGEQEAA